MPSKSRHRKRRVLVIIAAVLLAGSILFRIALPGIVKDYVNQVLDRDPDYAGSVEDIDIAIILGQYSIRGIDIVDTSSDFPVPLFAAESVHLSVEWKALLDGALVGELVMVEPRVNFVAAPAESQTGDDADWREVVTDLFPLRINRFEIVDGEIRYADYHARPEVELAIEDFQLEARNLTNSADLSGTRVASLTASGFPEGYGRLAAEAQIDPYTDLPTFNANIRITEVPLVPLNDLTRAYGRFDVESGEIDVFVELVASSGRFTGYVKPILRDVKVFRLAEEREDEDGPLQMAWEAIVGGAKGLLENDRKDQVATRIPISGTLDDPKVSPWPAIRAALTNAFIQALFNGFDNTIGWEDAPGRGDDDGRRDEKKKKKKDNKKG